MLKYYCAKTFQHKGLKLKPWTFNFEVFSAVASISTDMINEVSVGDFSDSGGDGKYSSVLISIPTECDILEHNFPFPWQKFRYKTWRSHDGTNTATNTNEYFYNDNSLKEKFLKTKDIKVIKTENRTETTEPEIIVDPNIIPKKGNQWFRTTTRFTKL